jgi:hypothetical protein
MVGYVVRRCTSYTCIPSFRQFSDPGSSVKKDYVAFF